MKTPAKGSRERCEHSKWGLGRCLDRPKVFYYFQHSRWRLLTLDHNQRTILIPLNLIVHLVMLCDVLVYDAKITDGKSKVMVLILGKKSIFCFGSLGELDTLGIPEEMSR